MTEEVLFKTYDLLDEIKQMPEYVHMKKLKKEIDENLFELVNEFNILKNRFNKEENKYSNEYKELCSRLSLVKEKLYTEPLVVEYMKMENTIQSYLDLVHKSLVSVARGE